jgi:hypothetical protein
MMVGEERGIIYVGGVPTQLLEVLNNQSGGSLRLTLTMTMMLTVTRTTALAMAAIQNRMWPWGGITSAIDDGDEIATMKTMDGE